MLFTVLQIVYKYITSLTGQFFTFHTRPVSEQNFERDPQELEKNPKTAIIIQGPLILSQHFTVDTLKIYRRIFPKQLLILSTWEDENAVELEDVKQIKGVHLILSKKPRDAGIQHINYQIISASAGAKYAKSKGCKYLLKTRTDQRIYSPSAIRYLHALLKQFPVRVNLNQKQRIISTSLYTFKYRLYSISDMFLFGDISDMVRYLSPPLDTRKHEPYYSDLKTYSQLRLGEMYFSTKFLESCGLKLNWTLQQSWQSYADRFCICDKESIDLFWYKYDMFREYKFRQYGLEENSEMLGFKDWILLLQAFPSKKQIPEETLLRTFMDKSIQHKL